MFGRLFGSITQPRPRKKSKRINCDFCGKSSMDVDLTLQGLSADICNECVDKCRKIYVDMRTTIHIEVDTGEAYKGIQGSG